jgi:hypothetical protein
LLTVLMSWIPSHVAGDVVLSDDFEDGIIDSDLWLWGGERRAWEPWAGPKGSWIYSHMEHGGYLQAGVTGPLSGMTYGAEAWVRTKYDFNDGKPYVINFEWEADVADAHYNAFHIQITDGFIPPPGHNYVHWHVIDPTSSKYLPGQAGTADLLWEPRPAAPGGEEQGNWLSSDLPKSTWSMQIDPAGMARLYDAPDASGSLLREEALDTAKPWHLRFMTVDATSAGFSSGDSRLRLHDLEATVVPEPSILVLLSMGTLALPAYAWRRRRGL